MTQPVTDWDLYRKCPIDGALTGELCTTAHARIEDGQPVGGRTVMEHPHNARSLRVKARV